MYSIVKNLCTALATQKYTNVFQNLNDENIMIRPDKGKGVVILNKSDYFAKISSILSDPSKLKPLNVDLTATSSNLKINQTESYDL